MHPDRNRGFPFTNRLPQLVCTMDQVQRERDKQ